MTLVTALTADGLGRGELIIIQSASAGAGLFQILDSTATSNTASTRDFGFGDIIMLMWNVK